MRIGYFGSPPISACLLESLLRINYGELVFVVSNPDKRVRRSQKLIPTAVSRLLLENKSADARKPILLRPENIKDPSFTAVLKKQRADVFVIFAYGKILPIEILSLPFQESKLKAGSINLHASLLPQWRGASPLAAAVLNGQNKTGWSVQYVTEELDAGDVIAAVELPIYPEETCGELAQRILPKGIDLLLDCLKKMSAGVRMQGHLQNHEEATYCKKIHKETAQIFWQNSAEDICNQIRAYNPSPVAWSLLRNTRMQIYRTAILPNTVLLSETWRKALPGSFGMSPDRKSLWVKTGSALLSILELQLENRKRMQAKEFLNGYRQEGLYVLGAKV